MEQGAQKSAQFLSPGIGGKTVVEPDDAELEQLATEMERTPPKLVRSVSFGSLANTS